MSRFEGPALEEPSVAGSSGEAAEVADIIVVEDPAIEGEQAPSGGCGSSPDQASLSLVQRILLVTDGTVTRILEACSGEKVEPVKLSQSLVPWSSADTALDAAEGDVVLSRRILLRGAQSARNFLYAESLIVPCRLHPRLRHGLDHSDEPIGRLLWENRVETLRELVRWDLEPAGSCAAYFQIDPGEPVVSRTYRVVSQRQAIMLITEKFPANSFPD
jgi:chorismate-pyruvate lyase